MNRLGVKKIIEEKFPDATVLNTENEQIWNKWMEFKERDGRDLVELISGDYNDIYKKRALLILNIPNIELLPFSWNKGRSENYLFFKNLYNNKFSQNLIEYTADLIFTFIDLIRKYPNLGENLKDTLKNYGLRILELFPLIHTQDMKAKIFKSYPLKELVSAWHETFSPFGNFLVINTEEVWKRYLDADMREIVMTEFRSDSKLQKRNESAAQCYASTISLMASAYFKGTKYPYSKSLLIEQIEFLIKLYELNPKKIWLTNWRLIEIYSLLPDDLIDLRQRLAQLIVFYPENYMDDFIGYSSDNLELAKKIFSEFEHKDVEFSQILSKIIQSAEIRITEDNKKSKNIKDKEKEIINMMRP